MYKYVFAAGLLLLFSYKNNFLSYTPNVVYTGKTYTTMYAEVAADKVVLIAREDGDRNPSYDRDEWKIFIMSLADCNGYPPAKFSIRFGSVYPLSWSQRWGSQSGQ